MVPKLIFDAHLDLAGNALGFDRDLRLPLEGIHDRNLTLNEKGSARNVVCFPEMRRGNVGLCVATQVGRHRPSFARTRDVESLPGYASREQAWAVAQGQLAWYREMEGCGEMVQIRTRTQLGAHTKLWLEAPPNGRMNLPIGYILSFENADPIGSLKHLERAYADGLRAIGPVHYGLGVYGHDTEDEGPFTPRGQELLKEMERLGIILDATNLCDESFWDAMRRFEGPVWASRSNSRAIGNQNRQLDDEQIEELIRRGAVIGMAFNALMIVPDYISGRSQPADFGMKIERICEHIDHICQLAGNARHVGIGTDFGGGFGTEHAPINLDSIADIGRLGNILSARGYKQDDIDGVFYANFFHFVCDALG